MHCATGLPRAAGIKSSSTPAYLLPGDTRGLSGSSAMLLLLGRGTLRAAGLALLGCQLVAPAGRDWLESRAGSVSVLSHLSAPETDALRRGVCDELLSSDLQPSRVLNGCKRLASRPSETLQTMPAGCTDLMTASLGSKF